MVRELMKAEQARGALLGTPGSTHERHSTKPPRQYGPGFFGGRGFTWGFVLATLLSVLAFAAFVVYEETQHAEEVEEHQDAPGIPGSDHSEESRDTSGTALGPPSTGVEATDTAPLPA